MTLYDSAKKLLRLQFGLMGWKVYGIENMPVEGPVILAINHVSFWDPIVAACCLPRQVFFMAKEELFNIPVLGKILRKLGAFPVKHGQSDLNAIRQSLTVLKGRQVLGLFPEEIHSKSENAPKGLPGMVLLMERSKASVVPVKVLGSKQLLRKGWGNLAVVVGQPLTAQMLKAPVGVGNRREWIADRIMQAMYELPEAQ